MLGERTQILPNAAFCPMENTSQKKSPLVLMAEGQAALSNYMKRYWVSPSVGATEVTLQDKLISCFLKVAGKLEEQLKSTHFAGLLLQLYSITEPLFQNYFFCSNILSNDNIDQAKADTQLVHYLQQGFCSLLVTFQEFLSKSTTLWMVNVSVHAWIMDLKQALRLQTSFAQKNHY